MRKPKRVLPLALAIFMIASMLCVSAFAETGAVTSWENGKMPSTTDFLSSLDANREKLMLMVDADGNWPTHYYEDTSVFSYVVYVQKTNDWDQAPGFYSMELATSDPSAYAQYRYRQGYYSPYFTVNEATSEIWGKDSATWSNGVGFCASYHGCPGVAFTAPYTGTVKFDFSYILNLIPQNDSSYSNKLLIGRSDMTVLWGSNVSNGYENIIKEIRSEDDSQLSASDTITLDVTEGEKIYFIIDGSGAGESRFWLEKVAYTVVDGVPVTPDTTETDTGDADAPNTAEPTEQTTGPEEQTTTPTEQTTGPEEQITAPTDQTTGPEDQTTLPTEQTDVSTTDGDDAATEGTGCSSSAGLCSVVMLSLLAAGVATLKKKED